MQRPIDFTRMTLDELTPIVSMRPGKDYSREEIREARMVFMEMLYMTEPPGEVPETESTPAEKPVLALEEENRPFEETTAPAEEMEAAALQLESKDDESFVLESESRLARFLYILYVYVFVPVLAVESLVFLISTVMISVRAPETPFLLLHILSAAFYAMFIAVSWHQILHRTKFGLFLNRSLIGVCIFRGTSMLLAGTSVLMGILFLAISFLFLIFFVGYDSTFIIQSRD